MRMLRGGCCDVYHSSCEGYGEDAVSASLVHPTCKVGTGGQTHHGSKRRDLSWQDGGLQWKGQAVPVFWQPCDDCSTSCSPLVRFSCCQMSSNSAVNSATIPLLTRVYHQFIGSRAVVKSEDGPREPTEDRWTTDGRQTMEKLKGDRRQVDITTRSQEHAQYGALPIVILMSYCAWLTFTTCGSYWAKRIVSCKASPTGYAAVQDISLRHVGELQNELPDSSSKPTAVQLAQLYASRVATTQSWRGVAWSNSSCFEDCPEEIRWSALSCSSSAFLAATGTAWRGHSYGSFNALGASSSWGSSCTKPGWVISLAAAWLLQTHSPVLCLGNAEMCS